MHGTLGVRRGAALAAVVLALPAAVALAVALTGFVPAPGSPFEAGRDPRGVVAADFDVDGNVDLAVANRGSDDVSVLLGDGTGRFPRSATLAVGGQPDRLAAADFDGDGDPDLATTNYGSDTVSILLAGPGAQFGVATTLAVGDGPVGIAAADFDGDGGPDLAVANSNAANLSILRGRSGGRFEPPTDYAVGDVPIGVAAADFDGDGNVDVATANEVERPAGVSILLGDGAGGFGPARHFRAGDLSFELAVADFDGDRQPDLAVANCNSDDVSILRGLPGARFEAPKNVRVGDCPWGGVVAADLNGDRDPDLAVANFRSHTISVLLGRDGASFGAATNFPACGPYGIAAAEMDGDGRTDLAVAHASCDEVSVLLNTVPTAPSRPRGVRAIPGNRHAVVLFSQPAADGGLPVRSYTATAVPGGRSVTAAGGPITVRGLANGRRYRFVVTATNAFGTSRRSVPSNAVTPRDRRSRRSLRPRSRRFETGGAFPVAPKSAGLRG